MALKTACLRTQNYNCDCWICTATTFTIPLFFAIHQLSGICSALPLNSCITYGLSEKKGSLRSHAAWAWAHGIMGGCSRPVFSHGKRVVSPCCEWWKCKRPVLPSTCQGTKWQLGGFKPAPKNRRVASGDVTLIAIENECFIWFYGKIMGIYGDTLW